MTKTTMTYVLPAEPEGPVWDSHGKRWTPTALDGWWLRDVTGVQCTWARLLEGYGPLTDAPETAWPTAPYVWHDGKAWVQAATETYFGDGSFWGKYHLKSETVATLEAARRFAREAIPVTIVPAAEWEILRQCVEAEGAVWDAAEALVAATERLGQADE